MERLLGKTALVTGGGSGIGRSIAIGFAAEGANVVVGDIDLESAQETVHAIKATRGQAVAVQVDVGDANQVEGMFSHAGSAFGDVDILVAAAGIISVSSFLDLSENEWDRVMEVNLKGMFLCGQAAARRMVTRGGGSIVNVTSQLSMVAQPNNAHYVASKGGARMLTQAMALDLAPFNIRVNALAPGLTRTNLGNPTDQDRADLESRLMPRIPLARAAEPEEMVGAAVYLASDEASYVTGTTLFVDGGYLAN